MLGRVLFAGGGTGGHIYMAVAIRQELERRNPAAKCLFVGTRRGLESTILPPLSFPLKFIDIGGINRVGLRQLLTSILQAPRSLVQAWKIVRSFCPDGVLGLGGYSSGPLVVAARLAGFPCVIVEPNVVPGLTNRWLSRWANASAVAFEETRHDLQRAELTGIPIREAFFAVPPLQPSPKFRVLVFGGSRGSRPINQLVCSALPHLGKDRLEIVHQTGTDELDAVKEAYRQAGFAARVQAYIEDMPAEFGTADLVISRAGASTVAELTAAGRPSILIPFPQAADDHQRRNAKSLESEGAAIVLEQDSATGEQLARLLLDLGSDGGRLLSMAEAARRLSQPSSASRIVSLLERAAERRSHG